jgi:membrane-bound lytic murein transglycosylase D
MRQYIVFILILSSRFTSLSQSAPIGPVGPACDKTLVGVDTMLSEVKLKYKSAVNYNRDALNVYGYQTTDIPTFNDSVIAYRMKLIETPIPMDYNNYVKAYIDLYSQRRRESVSKMLGASNYYFPLYEEILDKYNLPHEFKYLSVVESALNPNAQSWCGATGLWQFMYSTGLNYGLSINAKVDERRDPVRATEAMCQYITSSYNQFGDWLLAIASYNCGPGWVAYAVRKGGSNNFWEIQQYLPAETRGYVPAFLAACYVFKYAPEHNLFPAEPDINYPVERVEIDQSVSYYQLSEVLGVSISELTNLNPSFKKGYVSIGYKTEYITLPQSAAIKFWGNKQKVYNAPDIDYSVTAMAANSQTPVASAVTTQGNDNKTEADIKHEDQDQEEVSDIPVKGNYKKIVYKVQLGDNLNYVCQRYNCDKGVIMQWNNLRSETLCEGEEIKIYIPKENSN